MTNSNYKPMLCPVCGKFYFSEPQEGDTDYQDFFQCSVCGWKYDIKQLANPDAPTDNGGKSLNEYRHWYNEKITTNPTYNFLTENYTPTPHLCPVCGRHKFRDIDSFEICPICGWTDDSLMENEPDKWAGNSNDLCLNEYRDRYHTQSH